MMIQGTHQHKPPLPFAPGGEAAGEVGAVGAMRMLENREVVGKCVVTMNGYEFEGT